MITNHRGDTITLSAVLLARRAWRSSRRLVTGSFCHLPVQVWQQSQLAGFLISPPNPFAGDSIV